MNVKAYLVGGTVRDRLLGIRSNDIDYAVEAESYDAMREWIVAQGSTIFLEKPEYVCIRALRPGKKPADYVLCRKDGYYSDGRHPDTVTPGTLADDLARRDFTVNAIAYDEDEEVYIDPHDGMRDLAQRQLKCVGTPEERFKEDALRMLRAVRFSITRDLSITYSVSKSLKDSALCQLLTKVSEERRREELTKCCAKDSVQTMRLLVEYPHLLNACFDGGRIWLKATMEER
jgi:tRNA nucleotidyltransferase/poly(A) polymerase